MNQDQIEKYVAGRLGRDEAEAFEAYCVANPDFARQVEFEQRLRDGIEAVGGGSTAEFVRAENPWRLPLGIAASLIVVLGVGWFLLSTPTTPRPLLATVAAAQQKGPQLRLALERGGHTVPALPRGHVRVEIAGLFDTDAHYSVSLERIERHTSARTLATLYGQHPTSPVALDVMIDSDDLAAGAYSLRVSRQSSDEDPVDFQFVKN